MRAIALVLAILANLATGTAHASLQSQLTPYVSMKRPPAPLPSSHTSVHEQPAVTYPTAAPKAPARINQAAPLFTTVGGTWTEMGPKPIQSPYYGSNSGVVTAIAADPTDANTIYVGTVGGGVWKSTNAGTTWSPITDQAPSLAIGSLAIDPTNHLTVYAGTGAFNDGGKQFGAGVLKSLDGGASWTVVGNADGSFYGRTIHQLVVVPQTPNVLFITTDVGIFRSMDAGLTWTSIYAFFSNSYSSGAIAEIAVDPTNNSTVMASVVYQGATSSVSAILRSTDGGTHWATMTSGLPASGTANRISLTMSRSNPLRLYAAMSGSPCTVGVFRSDDGGLTWSQLANVPDIFAINIPGFYYCQGWYDNYIAADPTNPDIVYVGGIDVWKITGAGAAITRVTNSYGQIPPIQVHPDQHSLAFASTSSGSIFYIGNDGGIWKTADAGGTFINLNATLETSLMYHGVAQTPTLALAGLQDNGVLVTNGIPAWRQVYGGDGSAVAIDYNTPSTMYMSAYSSLYVQKSSNGGLTWAQAATGIDPADQPGLMYQPMIVDPNSSTTLLAGAYTGKIYRTTNAATTWSSIGLPDASVNESLAIATGNSQEIWAGYWDGKVFVTTNGGGTWTNRSPTFGPGFSGEARGLAIDPKNPLHAFVAVGTDFVNFFGGANGAIFETTDLGVTWTDISGAVASMPVNTLAVDSAGTLYAGTSFGVYARVRGSWGLAGSGLPDVRVDQLMLSRDESTLYAATYGRGMWTVLPKVVPVPPPPTNVMAMAGDREASLTWKPPVLPAGAPPVTSYLVTASPSGATTTVAAAAPAATVSGLINSVGYTFTVAAISSAGVGPSSNPSNTVYPGPAPIAVARAVLPVMANAAYGGYTTLTYIANLGLSAANVSVKYFDQSGNAVGNGNSVLSLPPSSTWTLRQDNGDALPAGQAGSAIVDSDQPVATFVNEFAPGGGDATSYTGLGFSGTGATLFAPAIANGAYGGYSTGIGLVNIGTTTANITITYRDTAGTVVKSQAVNGVAPSAYRGLYSGDATLALPGGFAGTATIASDAGQALAAVVNETGPGNQFSSYDAVPTGNTTLFAPAALRNAYGGYNTGTGIQNTTGTAGTVTVTYYNGAGTPSVTTHPIAANGYLGIYQGADIPADGAYTAKITSDVAIAAIVNEVAPSGNPAVQQSTAYNAFSSGSSSLHLPLVESGGADGWSTGEGIMNTGASATTVTVTYYDSATRALIGTPQTLLLQPNAYWGVYQPTGGLPGGSRASALIAAPGGQLAVICNESSATSLMSYTAQ